MRTVARLSAMLALLALIVRPAVAASSVVSDPLDQADRDGVRALCRQLNRHDLAAVRPLVWADRKSVV